VRLLVAELLHLGAGLRVELLERLRARLLVLEPRLLPRAHHLASTQLLLLGHLRLRLLAHLLDLPLRALERGGVLGLERAELLRVRLVQLGERLVHGVLVREI